MKQLVSELRQEPPLDPDTPVQVAGDPEKKVAEVRRKKGIPLRSVDIDFFEKIASDYNISFRNSKFSKV